MWWDHGGSCLGNKEVSKSIFWPLPLAQRLPEGCTPPLQATYQSKGKISLPISQRMESLQGAGLFSMAKEELCSVGCTKTEEGNGSIHWPLCHQPED